MTKEALELFKLNYANQGDCFGLPKFLKSFKKVFRKEGTEKTIPYYPWAVIERIFRVQGGRVAVVDWVYPITTKVVNQKLNPQTGEMEDIESVSTAFFMHLKAEWQGEIEEEFYPLFDSQNAQIILTPDAMDLNNSRQRGSVRLISRLSGIGLDVFEQQDPFDENGEGVKPTVIEKPDDKPKGDTKPKGETKPKEDVKPQEKPKEDVKPKEKPKEDVKPQEKPKEEPKQDAKPQEKIVGDAKPSTFFQDFLQGNVIDTDKPKKEEPKPQETPAATTNESTQTFAMDSEERANLLLEVRKIIKDGGFAVQARDFIKSFGKDLLSELSYDQLLALKAKVGK